MTSQATQQNGQAVKVKHTFKLQYSVKVNIAAPAEKIWGLLTNAADFPKWNSTVEKIEGQIALNEKITVSVKLSKRPFHLKVSELVPNKKMVWQSGAAAFKGVRTYTLTDCADGTVDFEMEEVFSGFMLPLIAGSLPDFTQAFEDFAADLKMASEAG
ncbi:SRPBCC domain-containing protein [uncultured Microscilla sp.]|uniref:SRPBCC domain-containing protein n=1 Tax=uncultured Microscilla sp. TaxID=432653 RepID=UPI00261AE20B|nr:SRPBCC domain-containing protein [uncultured Microscilla sp.]